MSGIEFNNSYTASDNQNATVHEEYFTGYVDISVHELMIKDRARTLAYRDFFTKNPSIVKDKVVMDVGAGTGILSLFAASLGAKKVYAVEASDMAEMCMRIVKANNFDGVIEVIHQPVEEVELPSGVKVDVILSEWMGFYLLHEAMLDSVLVARDRWLKEDGVIVPYTAKLYIAPVNMEAYLEEHVECWRNVYGFDFSPMVPIAQACTQAQPIIDVISPKQLMAPAQCVMSFNLRTVKVEAVQQISEWIKFTANRSGDIHGYAVWFDVIFRPRTHQAFLERTDSTISTPTEEMAEVASVSEDNDGSLTGLPVTELSVSVSDDTKAKPGSQPQRVDLDKQCAPLEASTLHGFSVPEDLVVVLSTSPSSPVTHWKQVVVLLPAAISVKTGDTFCCVVELKQDLQNKRRYVINVETEGEGEDSVEVDDDDEVTDYDTTDHPIPCDCGGAKCRLIQTIMSCYGEEQKALEDEAQLDDVRAEMEAVAAMDSETPAEEMNVSSD